MKKYLLLFLLLAGTAHAEPVRQGAVSLSGTGLGASVIDANGTYVYFLDTGTYSLSAGTYTQTTSVTRVKVSNLSAAGSPFVSVSTFTQVPVLIHNAAVVNTAAGFAYFAYGQSSPTISQLDLGRFVQVSSAAFSLNFGHFSCGVIDPTTSYAYFGTDTSPAQVVQVDLTNLTVVSSFTLPSPNANLRSAIIDTQNHFVYFGSSTTPGNVAQISLTNFSLTGTKTLTFNTGTGTALSGFIDVTKGYLWFGTGDSPGQVVQIQLNTFKIRGTPLVLNAGENSLASVVYDAANQAAYFGTDTSTGIVVEVNPIGMSRVAPSLILNSGEAYLETAVMDSNHYGYFGTMTNPGKVVQVDLIGGVPEITSNAPPEEEVSVGQTATFNVTASGRNLTYQWKRNGTAISGATQTTYQLANVALTDDGAIFNCTVSNSSGTAVSGSTTLTVDPDVQVFPNPWRANRHASLPVTFNEIPPGASVEIFTLAAQWVRTIPESGGIAAWDLKTNSGQNAASGYYFYYVKTTDDRHTLRGKFAIIR